MKFNVTLHESPLQGHLTVLKVAVCHTAGHNGGTMSMMFYICFAVGGWKWYLVTQFPQSRRQALDVLSAAESVLPISDSEVTCGPMAKPATLN